MTTLYNFQDFRQCAKKKLPRFLFEYIDRGCEDEKALTRLRQSFDQIRFVPKVLQGVTHPDIDSTYMGQSYKLPFIIAPTALAGIVAYNGEAKLARAAARANIPFTVSTQSVTTIEEIKHEAPKADLWFQLYMWKNRELSKALLDRVWANDITTLVVTADTPISPNREYNLKNGFSIPFKPSLRTSLDVCFKPHWLFHVLLRYLKSGSLPSYGHYPEEFRHNIMSAAQSDDLKIEDRLTWDDIKALRQNWKGKIVLKGILSKADALKAVEIGMDAIIVSAHGGRNLDIAATPLDVLPDIVDCLKDRMPVFADSGVQRGSDALKLLSSGAKAVLLGRAPLWGLAAHDEKGADEVLTILTKELRQSMIFLGVQNIKELLLLDTARY